MMGGLVCITIAAPQQLPKSGADLDLFVKVHGHTPHQCALNHTFEVATNIRTVFLLVEQPVSSQAPLSIQIHDNQVGARSREDIDFLVVQPKQASRAAGKRSHQVH